MIVFLCSIFMVYEWFAYITHKPKVSDLSHRRPWAYLVWGWFVALGIHFIREAQREDQERLPHDRLRP